MDVAIQNPMTITEFLDWEERQELRYEFDGERPIAMNGGTIGHEVIGDSLRFLLRTLLAGSVFRSYGPGVKIEVAGRVRYPDAFIASARFDRTGRIMPEPVVVFEVVSPGSSRTDRFAKLREYQSTSSIQQYVILEQDSIAAMLFTRLGATWEAISLLRDEMVGLTPVGIELPLAKVYADLDLPDPEAEATDA